MKRVRKSKFSTFSGRWLRVAAALAVVGAAAGVFLLLQPRPPFSASVTSAVHFPLYYPATLPDGLAFTNASVKDGGVVIATYKNPDGDKLFLSEEAKPANFDFASYYRSILHNRKINTKYGDAYAGELPDDSSTTIINVVTAKTWMIMNTRLHFSASQIDKLVAGIRR